MTPLVRMVHAIAAALLNPWEVESVEERQGPGVDTTVVVTVQGRGPKGILVGRSGETISAIEHLVRRAGKVQKPPVAARVEVKDQHQVAAPRQGRP